MPKKLCPLYQAFVSFIQGVDEICCSLYLGEITEGTETVVFPQTSSFECTPTVKKP